MAIPLVLKTYLWLSRRTMPLARWHLGRRLRRGKEEAGRISERFGEASQPRPEGRVVWFHAASVGESLSILELIRRLIAAEPGLSCLVTTGTRTSAALLEQRLPKGAVHQFVPVDAMPAITGFLDHWRPDVAVWTESEIWPALIWETSARGIPMLMLNARMSQGSYRKWRRFRATARALLSRFGRTLAQDEATADRLTALGYPVARLEVTGSLKEGSVSLPHDEEELLRLRALVADRPVWCAASTHPGEEEPVIAALQDAQRGFTTLLTILVPRHPERGDAVAGLLVDAGLRVRRRSTGEMPEADTEVYLADTLGEMGLWYRLAPVSFVGGSLVAIGGHNPFEPAGLGSAVLHGSHVENFAEIYARLGHAGAAREVADAGGLGAELRHVLRPDVAAEMATAAWGVCSEGSAVTDRALSLLQDTLAGAAA